MLASLTGIVLDAPYTTDPRSIQSLTWPAGESGTITLTILRHSNNQAFDLTGCQVLWTVDGTSISRQANIADPASSGVVTFPVVAADTVKLNGRFPQDFWLTDASGNRYQVNFSNLYVTESFGLPNQVVTVPESQQPLAQGPQGERGLTGASGSGKRNAVDDYACVGDDATDNTAAINAAIADMRLNYSGGTLFFPRGVYRCTGSLNVSESANILFEGEGGQSQGEGYQPSTILRYTGNGARFIDARSASGFGFRHLCGEYVDTSFAGILLDLSHSNSGADTAYENFSQSLFCGISSACRLATLISLRFAIFNSFRECSFRFGRYGVAGREEGDGYCDGNKLYSCNFDNLPGAGIRDLGSGCVIWGCGFEGINDSPGSAMNVAYMDTFDSGSSVYFAGNWLGDAVSVQNWLQIGGGTWGIFKNEILGGQQSIKFFGSMKGTSIYGNTISGLYGIDFGVSSEFYSHIGIDIRGNHFDTGGNYPYLNRAGHLGIDIGPNHYSHTTLETAYASNPTVYRKGLTIGENGNPISELVEATVSFAGATLNPGERATQVFAIGAGPNDRMFAGYKEASLDLGLPLDIDMVARGTGIGSGILIFRNMSPTNPVTINAGTVKVTALRS